MKREAQASQAAANTRVERAPQPTQPRRTRRKVAPSLSPASASPTRLSGARSKMLLAQAFVELAPDAIVVADAAGRIVQVNHQTEVLFGSARPALLGHPIEQLLPERFHTIHRQHRADYAAEPHTRPMGAGLALSGRRQDGSEFPVEVSLAPFQMGDELLIIASIRDIAERTRLEREHAAATEQLRLQAQLIESAHDAILVRDSESRIVSWNHGAEALYGWTPQEAIGQVSHTLFQTRFPTSREAIEEQLAREGRWEGDLRHTCRDGREVIVESRQVLARDERDLQPTLILEINRNITKRKLLEAAERAARLAAEQRRTLLQRVLAELPGGAYLVRGADARLVLANHAAEMVWGAHWALDQPIADFLRVSGIQYFAENGQPLAPDELVTVQIVRGGPHVHQRREVIRRPDGTRLPVLLNAVRIEAALSVQDTSEAGAGKQTSAVSGSQAPGAATLAPDSCDLDASALVLLQDISAIQAAEQLKDEFVSLATHELRTPLAAIQGFASMLSYQSALGHGPALADWQQEAIAEIESATARLNTLVNDLLDATRIQAGRLMLQPTPLDLLALVRRCLARQQVTTTQHTLTLEAPDEPVVLSGDEMRLEQVLGNLLGNAIKYSPAGGPIAVTVRVDPVVRQVEVRIRDVGIGIPADDQARLFLRFVRARNVHDHHIAGSGLGLYVCRELVEQHGGHLWFESVESEGTTFILTLPLLVPASVENDCALW